MAPSGKTLVTGATGHLGANLVRRLLDDGHDVRILLGPEESPAHLAAVEGLEVERVTGDLRNPDDADKAVSGTSRVFHVAAKISTLNPTPAQEREMFDINVMGTHYMLEAAKKHAVDRFVLTGSFSATGYHPDDHSLPSDETVPFYPFDEWLPYTRSKVLAEHETLKAAHDGLDACIATSCAILGPNDFIPSRLGRVLCEFAAGKLKAYVPGGFMFVAARDVVDGHVLCMEKGRRGQKYIFGTVHMTMDDLLTIYEEVTGKTRPMKLPPGLVSTVAGVYYGIAAKFFPNMPQRMTPAAIKFLGMYRKADTTKAQEELGYRPTDIRDAVREQYEFFVEQGKIVRTHQLGAHQEVTP